MNEPIRFDVEVEFTEAIKTIGGVRVTDLLGDKPGHLNADFAFPADSVVAELKCLEKDQILDEKIIEKASALYLEALNAKQAPVIVFGTVRMTTEGFPEEYVRRLANLYRIPIERHVKKAANQISQTAAPLNMTNPVGVLLLANDNHTALDPAHMVWVLREILAKPGYESIDVAIAFAGNLGAAMPGCSTRVDYWLQVKRHELPPGTLEFLKKLREAWVSRLEKIFGTTRAHEGVGDIEALKLLESRRGTKI